MLFEKDKKIIRREFQDNNPLEIIRISNDFVDDFLFQENKAVDIPINALRIIFNIISILRNEQFIPEKQPMQLSLFDEEFETENNVFATMKIKNSKISPKRSSRQLINAYEFLTKFKMAWYSSKNSQGKEVKTFGGLISIPSYQERGYTSFLISSYWLKKLIFIPEYNHVLYNLVYNIKNNKHILFALWLSKIPENGTQIKRTTLNEKFGINYKNSNDICFKFLKPIRVNLNKFNELSFNYKYEKDIIYIIPYLTKHIKQSVLSDEKEQARLINQRLKYFIKRYSLEAHNLYSFSYGYKEIAQTRSQIEEAYKIFVKANRTNGKKSIDFKGVMFLQEIQNTIIEVYRNTETGKKFPNAFLVII